MALMITMSKSAAAAKKYFTEALRQSDYLSEEGARPGVWFGKGAERLGLEGEVTAKDFGALASNKDPNTGKRLTVRDVKNARPGYDFTSSPPKSVSALWARTGDERLAEAFRESVLDTLSKDIEPEMKTRLRRGRQDANVVTGNLAAALFFHETTRPLEEDSKPDPHLHIHAYVFNRTWAPHEKRWQAAQLGDLHLDGRYFESAFEARLGARLRQLGYVLEANDKGSFEIVGVPASVNEKFSRRTFKEIEPEARKRGLTGAAKANLAKETRLEKSDGENLTRRELGDYWNGRLTSDEAAALDAVHAAAAGGGSGLREVVSGKQAMDHAMGHFFGPDGRASAEAEKDVLQRALRYGAGDVLPEDAKQELARRDLIRAEIEGRMVCTTQEVLAEEQAMSRSAWSGRNSCVPLDAGKPYVPDPALLADQQEAVAQLLRSQDQVMMLLGKAGATKTTTLKGFDAALRERGRQLMAFAPTARASRGVLRAKGFENADTLKSLLDNRDGLQEQLRGNVILIDEAGLAGTRAIRQVFDLVEEQRRQGYDTRCLLVGDPQQHHGVPRGQVLSILQDQAGLTPVWLKTIRRQIDPEYRKAVELLSEGKAGEAFDLLDKLGFIEEIADPEERYRKLAGDYADRLAKGEAEMIISPTHKEGRDVSAAVREELKARDKLGAEDRLLVRYESKQRTIEQRKDAAMYQAGDMVQWSEHAPGFRKGSQVTVVGREDGCVRVQDAAGKVKELPLELAERFELYRTGSLAIAEGERLRVTRNGSAFTPDGKTHRLNNGDVITVHFTPKGDLIDQRGWIIPASYGHLAHGVVTSHASQGMDDFIPTLAQSTASRGAASAEQFYVSVSRGKKAVHIVTDDKEALRAAVVRSDRARSAAEVFQASERERLARQQARRKAWWQRSRRAFAAARVGTDRLAKRRREEEALQGQRKEQRGLGYAQS
jgi:conjugative relaxase-like TrwC/TraI family protein